MVFENEKSELMKADHPYLRGEAYLVGVSIFKRLEDNTSPDPRELPQNEPHDEPNPDRRGAFAGGRTLPLVRRN